MAQQKVQLFAQARGVTVETAATIGATVGVDLRLQDGTIVTKEMLGGQSSGVPQVVYWRTIADVPPNVEALANQSGAGIFVLDGSGNSAVRTIAGTAGQIDVTDGSGVAGDPTIALADVANVAGGAIQLTAFDAKGRATSHNAATTDNLTEGTTNLWFTQARVRSTTLLGLTTVTGGAITSTDTILQAFGKLQNQVSAAGTVTSVDITGSTGITPTGGPITSAGSITLTLSTNLQAWSGVAQPPADSKTYGLNNGVWTQAISDAPSDGSIYGRKDGAWVVVTGGGGGGGTVTSVDGSGGTTGLTLTGGPITGSGTLTIGGVLDLDNGGTGATTAAGARTNLGLGPLASLALPANTTTFLRGDGTWSATLTGALAATVFNASTGQFNSGNATALLSATGAGTVYLRPNGVGTSTGEVTVTTNGYLNATTGYFVGSPTGAVLAPGTSSAAYIRPGGPASTTAEFQVNAAAATASMKGAFLASNGQFNSGNSTALLSTTGAGTVYLRPNGPASAAGQAYVNSAGNFFARDLIADRANNTGALYLGAVANNTYLYYDGANYLLGRGAGPSDFTIWHTGNFNPGNYVSKGGDTMTGPLVFNGNINQLQLYNGAYSRLIILSSAGDCGIYDQTAGTWGLRYASNGYVWSRSGFVSGSNTFESASGAVVLAGQAGSAVYLRPNNAGSTSGQMVLDSNGTANLYHSTNDFIISSRGGYVFSIFNFANGQFGFWDGINGTAAALYNGASGGAWSFRGACSGTSFTSTSDVRKKNLTKQQVPRALARGLQLWNFTWKDSGQPGLSLTAQQAQILGPEYVASNDDVLSVDKGGFAIEAVAAVQIQADQQELRIRQLEAQVHALLARAA